MSTSRRNSDWRTRYSDLYSNTRRRSTLSESPHRISFMSNEETPYTSLLVRSRQEKSKNSNQRRSRDVDTNITPPFATARTTEQTITSSEKTEEADVVPSLLDLVRAQRQSSTVSQLAPCKEIQQEKNNENESETCMHGMSMRERDTERSCSRSRTSTRREIDINGILAFPPYPTAKKKIDMSKNVDISKELAPPRWSIRRSVCPVCSQKWKDRTSINNVKNSGLKRNTSMDQPSVIAPARLQTAIKTEYNPRPFQAVVDEGTGVALSGWRGGGHAAWQLTRARRYRPPPQHVLKPPPHAAVPPRVPLAPEDLDRRVNMFLADNGP